MSKFNKLIDQFLIEFAAGTEASTAFGPNATGNYGNQFPSQNDNAYAPGDARLVTAKNVIGAKKVRSKKGKGKKKVETYNFPIQRRPFKVG